MNYYELLEVSPKASPEVIKAAYKSLMQRYHPDRNPDNAKAAQHASLVIQAYEVLSDAGKRTVYDAQLLQQTAEHSIFMQGKSRGVPAQSASAKKASEYSLYLWLLFALIILIGWYFMPTSIKTQSSEAELKEHPEMPSKNTIEKEKDVEARTVPVYITDLTVSLRIADNPLGETSQVLHIPHVLRIPVLGVIVGTFDPDRLIQHIESNNEFISQKLAEKLTDANYDALIQANGEQYLKKIILDALGEITGTNRFEDYPSTRGAAPAHYGVVDVLFPESYSVDDLLH